MPCLEPVGLPIVENRDAASPETVFSVNKLTKEGLFLRDTTPHTEEIWREGHPNR